MRSQFLLWQSHQLKILLLFIAGFFSHMAYSADPIVCTPTGYLPEINIVKNLTVTPGGYVKGTGYVVPIPVAQPGPVTCATYTPTAYSIIPYSPTFGRYPNPSAQVNIGHNFMALLSVNNSVGLTDNTGNTYAEGNTPNVTQNVYPEIFIYPPSQKGAVKDFYVDHMLIGYMETTGVKAYAAHIATDTDGLTAVYFTGTIHVPPYCEFSQPNAMVALPTVFASDFVAAGVGGKVGPMSAPLDEEVTCSGGSTAGDDLVHISISSGNGSPVDSTDVIGFTNGNTDVGIQVYDGDGNQLQVNGPVAATVPTNPTPIGTMYVGKFNYRLQFQMISLTGKAPPGMLYYSLVYITLTMD